VRGDIILNTAFRDTWSGERHAMPYGGYEGHKPSVKREQGLSNALVLGSASLRVVHRRHTVNTNLVTHQSNSCHNQGGQKLGYEYWVCIQKLPETKYRI